MLSKSRVTTQLTLAHIFTSRRRWQIVDRPLNVKRSAVKSSKCEKNDTSSGFEVIFGILLTLNYAGLKDLGDLNGKICFLLLRFVRMQKGRSLARIMFYTQLIEYNAKKILK